jgi:GT2 family glycosyltransferase
MLENTAAILVSWNSAYDLDKLIPTLVETGDFKKIIIVDNGSTDKSVEMIKKLQYELSSIELLINVENLGFSGGVNRGIEYVLEHDFDSFCLLNCDIEIEKNSIKNLKGFLDQHSDYGAVSSVLLNPDGTVQVYGGGRVNWILGTSLSFKDKVSDCKFDYLSGACMLIRTEVVKSIGFFDETRFFMYWEDVDFGLRIKESGWKIGVCKNSRCIHEMSKSLGRFGIMKDYYTTRSLKKFFEKHLGIYAIIVVPIAISLKMIKRLIGFKFKNIKYITKGYFEK